MLDKDICSNVSDRHLKDVLHTCCNIEHNLNLCRSFPFQPLEEHFLRRVSRHIHFLELKSWRIHCSAGILLHCNFLVLVGCRYNWNRRFGFRILVGYLGCLPCSKYAIVANQHSPYPAFHAIGSTRCKRCQSLPKL